MPRNGAVPGRIFSNNFCTSSPWNDDVWLRNNVSGNFSTSLNTTVDVGRNVEDNSYDFVARTNIPAEMIANMRDISSSEIINIVRERLINKIAEYLADERFQQIKEEVEKDEIISMVLLEKYLAEKFK